MNIVLVIENSINSPGGVEILTRELIQGLAGRCNVFLASPDDDRALGADGALINELRAHFRIDPAKRGWRSDLAVWMGAQSIDLCHLQSGGTYGWGSGGHAPSLIEELLRQGIQCINTNHQSVSPWDANFRGDSFPRRFAGFLKRWPIKARHLSMAEREIMVSDHDLKVAARCYPFHAHKMHRIYHSRIDPFMELEPVPESRRIVSLATITPRKGQAVLVESFCRIAPKFPEWTLHLYGMCHDHAYTSKIRKKILDSGLGNRVIIEGSTDDHLAVLSGAEIYVQPSYLEALGLSLQEALFLERPCIGSRVGGIPELINHNVSGLLVSPGDVTELATALSQLISDSSQRARFGIAGKKSLASKNMDKYHMYSSYLECYNKILK